MRTMKKAFLSFFLIIIMILGMFPISTFSAAADLVEADLSATEQSWTWLFNDGVLIISGTGEVPDYNWQIDENRHEFVNSPWYAYRDSIFKIIVEEGITTIGGYAFAGCSNVTDLDIAESVVDIAETAFDGINNPSYSLTAFSSNDVASAANSVMSSEILRYSVLILDTSGSMDGTPCDVQIEAAKKFCQAVLESDGTNFVAIVKLNTFSSLGCSFTDDLSELTSYIDSIYAYGGTNINQALIVADGLLANIPENAVKNIVLCSDGLPESGSTSYDGPYNSDDDYYYYPYANAVYNNSTILKEKYNIYSLAFFHCLYGSELEFGRNLMKDVQNAGYYEVTDPNELEFVFGEVAGEITNNETKEITFRYQSGKDYTAKCWYSDNYFSGTSYDYKPSLATMSLSFAMSSFGSGDEASYANKSVNAKNLLKNIGCAEDSISTNYWFTQKPTKDSIAVIAGNKHIKVNGEDYTLIAAAVRGGGYESEWSSNFTIGLNGQHDGFDTAKSNVLEFLRQYISDKGISGKVKIWITGYSRAAATANLVGGALDSGVRLSDNISYSTSDIYVYCFEPPAGALTSQVTQSNKIVSVGKEDNITYYDYLYNNIYNIINSSDPVPYVAPAVMGFGRYGKDKYLPSAASSSNYSSELSKMLKIYNSLDSTEPYVVDNFRMKKIVLFSNWKLYEIQDDKDYNISQGVYLQNYVTYLARDFIRNRRNYVANYQNEIREIFYVLNGYDSEKESIFTDALVEKAKKDWSNLVISYVWNVGINPWGSEEDALKIVSEWIVDSLNKAGITDYDVNAVNSAGIYLADLVLALATNHPNYATTLVMNIEGIGAAHYPELCYSWLASMDENYEKGAISSYNNGSYRVIRINCDVDVSVYNTYNELVASISNESPDEVSSIISAINENGEKIVILPSSENYTISIKSRNNTSVNYGIDEYCAQAGDYTRAIDYFNIELNEGEILTGVIPAFNADELEQDIPTGSNAKYTLTSPTGEIIAADADLSGEDALNAYFNVTAKSSNDEYGFVTGSALIQQGNFAKVEAFANEGYSFAGWYVNDNLVTNESMYRFSVTSDTTLLAKFESKSSTIKPTIPQQPVTPSTPVTSHTVPVANPTNPETTQDTAQKPVLAVKSTSDTSIILEWQEKNNVTGYYVEAMNNGKWEKVKVVKGQDNTNYKVVDLSAATTYIFRVRTYTVSEGKRYIKKYSEEVIAITDPSMLQKFKASEITDNSIKLTWKRDKAVDGYQLQMYKNGTWITVKNYDKNTVVGRNITGLKSGKTYKFRIRSFAKDEKGKKIYGKYSTITAKTK